MTIWKDSKILNKLGKKMTKTIAMSLLTKGKANLKGCTSAKTGKKYDCILDVDFSGERPEYHLEFDHGGASGSVIGKCPFCGSDVAETAKAFTCTDNSCKAALWKDSKLYSNEMKIDAKAAKALLAGKTVKATIKSKDGTGTSKVNVGVQPYESPNGKRYISLCVESYDK